MTDVSPIALCWRTLMSWTRTPIRTLEELHDADALITRIHTSRPRVLASAWDLSKIVSSMARCALVYMDGLLSSVSHAAPTPATEQHSDVCATQSGKSSSSSLSTHYSTSSIMSTTTHIVLSLIYNALAHCPMTSCHELLRCLKECQMTALCDCVRQRLLPELTHMAIRAQCAEANTTASPDATRSTTASTWTAQKNRSASPSPMRQGGHLDCSEGIRVILSLLNLWHHTQSRMYMMTIHNNSNSDDTNEEEKENAHIKENAKESELIESVTFTDLCHYSSAILYSYAHLLLDTDGRLTCRNDSRAADCTAATDTLRIQFAVYWLSHMLDCGCAAHGQQCESLTHYLHHLLSTHAHDACDTLVCINDDPNTDQEDTANTCDCNTCHLHASCKGSSSTVKSMTDDEIVYACNALRSCHPSIHLFLGTSLNDAGVLLRWTKLRAYCLAKAARSLRSAACARRTRWHNEVEPVLTRWAHTAEMQTLVEHMSRPPGGQRGVHGGSALSHTTWSVSSGCAPTRAAGVVSAATTQNRIVHDAEKRKSCDWAAEMEMSVDALCRVVRACENDEEGEVNAACADTFHTSARSYRTLNGLQAVLLTLAVDEQLAKARACVWASPTQVSRACASRGVGASRCSTSPQPPHSSPLFYSKGHRHSIIDYTTDTTTTNTTSTSNNNADDTNGYDDAHNRHADASNTNTHARADNDDINSSHCDARDNSSSDDDDALPCVTTAMSLDALESYVLPAVYAAVYREAWHSAVRLLAWAECASRSDRSARRRYRDWRRRLTMRGAHAAHHGSCEHSVCATCLATSARRVLCATRCEPVDCELRAVTNDTFNVKNTCEEDNDCTNAALSCHATLSLTPPSPSSSHVRSSRYSMKPSQMVHTCRCSHKHAHEMIWRPSDRLCRRISAPLYAHMVDDMYSHCDEETALRVLVCSCASCRSQLRFICDAVLRRVPHSPSPPPTTLCHTRVRHAKEKSTTTQETGQINTSHVHEQPRMNIYSTSSDATRAYRAYHVCQTHKKQDIRCESQVLPSAVSYTDTRSSKDDGNTKEGKTTIATTLHTQAPRCDAIHAADSDTNRALWHWRVLCNGLAIPLLLSALVTVAHAALDVGDVPLARVYHTVLARCLCVTPHPLSLRRYVQLLARIARVFATPSPSIAAVCGVRDEKEDETEMWRYCARLLKRRGFDCSCSPMQLPMHERKENVHPNVHHVCGIIDEDKNYNVNRTRACGTTSRVRRACGDTFHARRAFFESYADAACRTLAASALSGPSQSVKKNTRANSPCRGLSVWGATTAHRAADACVIYRTDTEPDKAVMSMTHGTNACEDSNRTASHLESNSESNNNNINNNNMDIDHSDNIHRCSCHKRGKPLQEEEDYSPLQRHGGNASSSHYVMDECETTKKAEAMCTEPVVVVLSLSLPCDETTTQLTHDKVTNTEEETTMLRLERWQLLPRQSCTSSPNTHNTSKEAPSPTTAHIPSSSSSSASCTQTCAYSFSSSSPTCAARRQWRTSVVSQRVLQSTQVAIHAVLQDHRRLLKSPTTAVAAASVVSSSHRHASASAKVKQETRFSHTQTLAWWNRRVELDTQLHRLVTQLQSDFGMWRAGLAGSLCHVSLVDYLETMAHLLLDEVRVMRRMHRRVGGACIRTRKNNSDNSGDNNNNNNSSNRHGSHNRSSKYKSEYNKGMNDVNNHSMEKNINVNNGSNNSTNHTVSLLSMQSGSEDDVWSDATVRSWRSGTVWRQCVSILSALPFLAQPHRCDEHGSSSSSSASSGEEEVYAADVRPPCRTHDAKCAPKPSEAASCDATHMTTHNKHTSANESNNKSPTHTKTAKGLSCSSSRLSSSLLLSRTSSSTPALTEGLVRMRVGERRAAGAVCAPYCVQDDCLSCTDTRARASEVLYNFVNDQLSRIYCASSSSSCSSMSAWPPVWQEALRRLSRGVSESVLRAFYLEAVQLVCQPRNRAARHVVCDGGNVCSSSSSRRRRNRDAYARSSVEASEEADTELGSMHVKKPSTYHTYSSSATSTSVCAATDMFDTSHAVQNRLPKPARHGANNTDTSAIKHSSSMGQDEMCCPSCMPHARHVDLLSLPRTHVYLVLDNTLHHVPWEAMDVLRRASVSRIPSVRYLTHMSSGLSQTSGRRCCLSTCGGASQSVFARTLLRMDVSATPHARQFAELASRHAGQWRVEYDDTEQQNESGCHDESTLPESVGGDGMCAAAALCKQAAVDHVYHGRDHLVDASAGGDSCPRRGMSDCPRGRYADGEDAAVLHRFMQGGFGALVYIGHRRGEHVLSRAQLYERMPMDMWQRVRACYTHTGVIHAAHDYVRMGIVRAPNIAHTNTHTKNTTTNAGLNSGSNCDITIVTKKVETHKIEHSHTLCCRETVMHTSRRTQQLTSRHDAPNVSERTRPCVALIMGCSSARMQGYPDCEVFGMPYAYLHAGFAAFVGCLWDVTDREVDRLTYRILCSHRRQPCCDNVEKGKAWTAKVGSEDDESVAGERPCASLGEVLAQGRMACKLPYLSAFATVMYGVNVW